MKVVLLGGDLNAYSVAVSFHETYGVKSTAFCRYRCGITATSSIVEVRIEPNILDDGVGVAVLAGFARGERERPYLVPCSDSYVRFCIRNREALSLYYRFLLPSDEVYAAISDKAAFYSILDKACLPHPKTVVLTKGTLSLSRLLSIGAYPAVLKPSDSVAYYARPFEGMEKVYYPKTPKEAMSIAERIFEAGGIDRLLLQERIGSEKKAPRAKTLTLLFDKSGTVRRGVLGEVLVEETAAGARGNYAAILSRPPDALTCRLISVLEKLGFVGVCNIDILSYEGKSYVLELNPRQGRSCDYLRAAGVSLARFLVDAIGDRSLETDLSSRAAVFRAIPLSAVLRRSDENTRAFIRELKKKGRVISPFSYAGERAVLRKMIYLPIHSVRRTMALKTKEARGV